MSGIEVAGLILGAVPVIIAALEHYKTLHKKTWLFKNKSSRIDQLIIALGNQKFFLEGELELALLEAGFDRYDIASMDTSDLQRFLNRTDVYRELSRSLGRRYGPFKDTIVRCGGSLTHLVHEIKGLIPGSQFCHKSSSLEELLKTNMKNADGKYEFRSRIKFILKDDELKQRIDDLRVATDTLTKLRHLSKSLIHYKTHSEQKTVANYAVFLKRVQRYADVLHLAISRRLVSGCHHEHETRFYLENRSGVLQKQRESVEFRLVFGSTPVLAGGNLLPQELQVAVLDDDISDSTTLEAPKERRVTFDLPQPFENPEPLMAEVQNLCLSLDQARQASRTLKLYLSQRGTLSSRNISPGDERMPRYDDRTQELVTLAQILQQVANNGPVSVNWSPMQRMMLSFVLASSLLQLSSTQWMAEPWSKQSIYFWRLRPSPNADAAAFLVDTSHPFIVRKFGVTPTTCNTPRADARNQLLNLGILLLEIGRETSFEFWASAHGFTLNKAYGSRYEAASAWLDDSESELLSSYYDAVARCIECTFQTRSAVPSWEDLDFVKSVCELVVKPLWTNCSTTV